MPARHPSGHRSTLLTGQAVQQFPQPVQSSRSMAMRNEKSSEVPSRSMVSRILPLFSTPFGHASTQSPQRIQCPLWIRGIQPSPACTTSIAPGAGHAIMQKRACWQVFPVGSGNPRKCEGVTSGAVFANRNFLIHSVRANSFRYQTSDSPMLPLRTRNAGICRNKRRRYIGNRICSDDHLVAAGLDVHDGRGLDLDLNDTAELVAFDKVRQLPTGRFATVSRLSRFADAAAPYDPFGEILSSIS